MIANTGTNFTKAKCLLEYAISHNIMKLTGEQCILLAKKAWDEKSLNWIIKNAPDGISREDLINSLREHKDDIESTCATMLSSSSY